MKKNISLFLLFAFVLQFAFIFPASADPITTSVEFSNPLAFNSVEGFLANVLSKLQGIIVILSLIFIVIGSIIYITSGGNDNQMKLAKGAILSAMIGLAIGIAAPAFLREISGVLGWTYTQPPGSGTTLTLSQIGLNILDFLLGIFGTLALIMLIIGGIMYFGAGADEKSVEKGKSIVKYSIIGIVVALSSLTVVKQIANIIAG